MIRMAIFSLRIIALGLVFTLAGASAMTQAEEMHEPGVVRAAKLIYADNKTSVCFSDRFLADTAEQTHIATHPRLIAVRSDSEELFEYPFAVMTGEGAFTLSEAQLDNLRLYLDCGGFVIASAGCSSKPWNESFAAAMEQLFPADELVTLDAEHPIYHTVYDVTTSRYKSGGARLPELRALERDGRVVLVWSPDGLNDTANTGGDCCCCGGNEVMSAKLLNVNILAYALTH